MKPIGLRQWVEAIIAWTLVQFFAAMPVDVASALGGWLGRIIGYRLPVTRRARRNLALAYPELPDAEREALLLRMWDNLGRNAAEFPHIESLRVVPGGRIEVVGMEHLEVARGMNKGIVFFSAHCGNWELFGPASADVGIKLNLVYRAPNNRLLEWLFVGRGNVGAEMIPKGSRGARRALELLRDGKALGLLLDQKMNDGLPIPFFGRDAMTAPAVAQFTLKFGCPVVPSHIVRLGGAHFRMVIEPPLTIPHDTERHAAILAIMTEVNRIIEGWVREHPDQWLWVHRRWPD
jgi:KDO2-lipid IV(A) lauroyltransferase